MNRLIRLRSLLALALASVLGIAGFAGNRVAPSQVASISPAANSTAIPMLETIHVRAEAPIPTLPTVVVSAVAPEVSEEEQPLQLASASHTRNSGTTVADLPHARLDMPYYSFGKLVPRVIKE